MAGTLFHSTKDQVWAVALEGFQPKYFGSLIGVKNYLGWKNHGLTTEWEEAFHDGHPCSKLVVLTSVVRYGKAHVVETWQDTGWRAWRES